MLEQDLAAARTFVDGKLLGSWTCARYGAPLIPAGGSITFVTGAAAVQPSGSAAMVTAAFAAVEGLSRALAVELGPVRVNTIRPGYTDSEMWSGLSPARARRHAFARRASNAGRANRYAEDIAQAAIFLMNNRQTTGAVLRSAGGETLVDQLWPRPRADPRQRSNRQRRARKS